MRHTKPIQSGRGFLRFTGMLSVVSTFLPRRLVLGERPVGKTPRGETRLSAKPRVTPELERWPQRVGYTRIQSPWQIHPNNQTSLPSKNSRDASLRLWRHGNGG